MPETPHTRTTTLNCRDLTKNPENRLTLGDFDVILRHRAGEPEQANRLEARCGDFSVELLPSKGLSVGEAFAGERPLFWEPPVDLVNPDTLDLAGTEVWRNRQPAPGMAYIKTYMGSIEMLGLSNWGMPYTDPDTGRFHILHGEASNIPAETVDVTVSGAQLQMQGSSGTERQQ